MAELNIADENAKNSPFSIKCSFTVVFEVNDSKSDIKFLIKKWLN